MEHKVNSEQWWDAISLKYEARGDKRERKGEYTTFGDMVVENSKVLEIGSAYGMFSKYIPSSCEYVGWDISSKLISEAEKLNPNKYERKDIALYDINAADECKYDYTVCFQTLEHFTKDIFKNVMYKIKFLTKKELLFSVPRGIPSAGSMRVDGHLIGWATDDDLVDDFKEFGKVTLIQGDINHICGVVNYE